MNIQYLFTTSFIIAIFRCTPEKENYQQQMRVNNERRDREMEKDVETLPYGNIGAAGLQRRTVSGQRRDKRRENI